MDHRSPSFEATLLYKTAPRPDYEALVSEIRDIIEDHGSILLAAEPIDSVFTLLTCDTVQILLAFTQTPLPPDHFLEARRPAVANLAETAVLGLLNAHQATATVLVVDNEGEDVPYGQAFENFKRTLCWEIT